MPFRKGLRLRLSQLKLQRQLLDTEGRRDGGFHEEHSFIDRLAAEHEKPTFLETM